MYHYEIYDEGKLVDSVKYTRKDLDEALKNRKGSGHIEQYSAYDHSSVISDAKWEDGQITEDNLEPGLEICGELSENQQQFIQDAQYHGLDVEPYSGRGMYGKFCPSVRVDSCHEFCTTADVYNESMGLGVVIYARG